MLLLHPVDAGPLRTSRRLAVSVAGADSNFAIAMARLGWPAIWLSAVSQDQLGDLVVEMVAVPASMCLGFDATQTVRPESSSSSATKAGHASSITGAARRPAPSIPIGSSHRSSRPRRSCISMASPAPSARPVPRASSAPLPWRTGITSRLPGPEPAPPAVGHRERADGPDATPAPGRHRAGHREELLALSGRPALEEALTTIAAAGPAVVVAKRGTSGATALAGGKRRDHPGFVPPP